MKPGKRRPHASPAERAAWGEEGAPAHRRRKSSRFLSDCFFCAVGQDLRRWSYWPDLNRRPADYERLYRAFSLAAPGFLELLPRLCRENQQVNYPVSAFSSAAKTTFCGQLLGQAFTARKNGHVSLIDASPSSSPVDLLYTFTRKVPVAPYAGVS